MPSSISFGHHGLLLCNLFAAAAYATLPYTPSYIFPTNRQNSTLAYVLQPNTDQNSIEFLSLDLSSVDSDGPQSTVLFSSVPFAENDGPFIPILDTDGVINVIQGNCQGSQGTPLVWTFHADQDSHSGNGTWKSLPATNGSDLGYLASGFAFASSNDTSAELYTFGGMCSSADSTSANWVSAANYSQTMTLLAPDNSSQPSNYGIKDITSTDPPVAEAGYTITELQQTSSTTSTGRNIQQGGFLFIGGHTHNAFINMSTIALFSLPEAGWTYIPVDPDDSSPRTDLAARDTTEVEPRSGHTAVISSDGSRVIVFGGWVGDTDTPANPQLVVLEVGEDYGGSGAWTWTVPQPTGSGPSQDSGIFGHAATLLDGDVMMISGGYTISTTSANSKRDSSTFETNSQVHLYNITSNAWTTEYTQPGSQTGGSGSSGHGSESALSSSGEKAGLGIGVSVAAIAVVGVAYVVWSRKRWNHRRHRDKELRKLAFGAERSHIWAESGLESSYRNPEDDNIRNSILQNLYSSGQSHQYSAVPGPQAPNPEAERTGLLYEVPSPTRGLRRNLSGRPQRVQSAGWYDEVRSGYGAGSIHPIDERDEYETSPEAEEVETGRQTPKLSELADPFADPASPTRVPLITFPESPVMKQQGSDSMSVRSEGARSASPEKSERTNSSLSEASISNISDSSIQRSHAGSIRGRHLLQSAIPILEPSNNETTAASGHNSPEKSPGRADRLESDSVRWPFDRSGTVDSFSTSSSRRRQVHLEGEISHLLGSAPEWSTPPESPTRSLESEHKRGGSTWMGSLRKTLSNATKKAATSIHSSSVDNNYAAAATASETAPSPEPGPSGTRRPSNASIAHSHLQRRQGPRDWAIDGRQSRSSVMSLSHTDDDDPFDDDDDDWDVEAAVEGRLVQITYTVPKERLRVVNAGIADRVTVDDESDKESRASVG